MLTIILPKREMFDERTSEFLVEEEIELQLEHSLVSLSKWESLHEKPFLAKGEKSDAEVLSYIRAMILTPGVPDTITNRFTHGDFAQINAYIDAKMTATWFSDTPAPPSREVITSEILYYWMLTFNIPMECQHWHLNRLLTLIRVCNVKNQPAKKMSKAEVASRNRQLNAQRREKFGTTG